VRLSLVRRLLSWIERSKSSRGTTKEGRRDYSPLVVFGLLVALLVSQDPQDTVVSDAAAGAAPPAAAQDAATAVPAPTAQVEEVLQIARAEIGYREGPNNKNRYGAAYGVDNTFWCQQFVWWVFREAGAADLIHPQTAYTPTAADWHRDRGQWSTTPQVGSLVFFNWPNDSKDRIQHVGIVEAVGPGFITTIEGNTGPGNAGAQDDGDGVWRRQRPLDASIVGFGHPAYGNAA
jgi:hypothetical protein